MRTNYEFTRTPALKCGCLKIWEATVVLHLKWNTVFVLKILHEGFFTLEIRMCIDIAKP